MKKLFTTLFILFIFVSNIKSQTVVASYPFPNYSQYNSFWGITKIGDTLRIATDNNGTIYKVTETGLIRDSMSTPFTFNHGLAWDGSGYWIAEDFRSAGARLFKINLSGQRVDSIQLPPLIGGATGGVGDIELVGNSMWFSVYYPDFTSYPFTYGYKLDMTTRQITDTIPLRGLQVQGIAVKGDTIFYVNELFQGDAERIYAYRKATGDTIFSFPTPDPDGDCNPRGMYWDGQYLWLIADRIGNNMFLYRTLYKYSMTGQGNPQITTSSNVLDFGNTIIGTNTDRNLTITNSGSAKLIISNFEITNPRFTITPNNVPDTLNIGQTKNYTVKFTPTVFDTTSGQLKIASNDGVTPVKIVTLKGKGIYNGSNIQLSANNYDFGARRGTSLCGYIFSVTNTGSEILNIGSMQTFSQYFFMDTVGVSFPVSIDTQKTKQFRVWYRPPQSGTFHDSIRITSNAVNLPVSSITIHGSTSTFFQSLGDIAWQGTVPDNPYTISDNFKPVSIKQINDLNYDNVNEMIVASSNYLTTCFNGNSSVTSDILWSFNTGTNNNNSGSVTYEDAMQIRTDVDNDGFQDVVIGCGGGNEMIYTISGRTGKRIWAYGDSVSFSDGDINGVRADKDYNGDGVFDVIASASGESSGMGRRSVLCLNGLNGSVIFISAQSSLFLYDVSNTQIGGAVSHSNNGQPYFAQFFDNAGSNVFQYSNPDIIWGMRDIRSINADTIRDIVCQSGFNGRVFAMSGSNGSLLWERTLGSSVNGNVKFFPGNQELDTALIVSGQRMMNSLNPLTGADIWVNGLDNSYILGAELVGQTTFFRRLDIGVGTLANNFYLLDGNTGAIKFQYSFGNGNSDFAVEKIGRIGPLGFTNSDGNEMVVGSRDGRIICFSGGFHLIPGVKNISSNIPDKFSLGQNYPNPFNPVTKIKFDLPSNARLTNGQVKGQTSNLPDGKAGVKLVIYDALGKTVATLVNERLDAGSYEAEFNGANYSSGIYFYKLEAGNYSEVKRMVLLK